MNKIASSIMTSQQYANLVGDQYIFRPEGTQFVLDDVEYKTIKNRSTASGYQGAIYQRVDNGEIITVHRGTEFNNQPIRDGLIADGGMVFGGYNNQAKDAIAFTKYAMDYARAEELRLGSPVAITVAGHSLGGCLTQFTAHELHLKGETFNAYGAAGLMQGVTKGGHDVINHVMATDPVSAASAHYGEVRVYAAQRDISLMRKGGYSASEDQSGIGVTRMGKMGAALGDSHRIANFTPDNDVIGESALSKENLDRSRDNAAMIASFRTDVYQARSALSPWEMIKPAIEPVQHWIADRERQQQQEQRQAREQQVERARHEDAELARQYGRPVMKLGATGHVVELDNTPHPGIHRPELLQPSEQAAPSFKDYQYQLDKQAPTAPRSSGLQPDHSPRHDHTPEAAHSAAIAPQAQQAELAQQMLLQQQQQIAQLQRQLLEQNREAADRDEQHRENRQPDAQSPSAAFATADTPARAAPSAGGFPSEAMAAPGRLADTAPALQPQTPTVPEHLRSFHHEGHPLNGKCQTFMAALEKAQTRHLRHGSNLPSFSPEQHERIAASLTAANGTKALFEVSQFHLDKEGALWAANKPPSLFEKPDWVKIDLEQTLAHTPEAIATAWREHNLPAPVAYLSAATDPQSLSPDDMRHPQHPRHAMYEQVHGQLGQAYAKWGMPQDPAQLERQTACCVVAARSERMDAVGGLDFAFPNGRVDQPLAYMQQDPTVFLGKSAEVSPQQLVQAPSMEQNNAQLQTVEQQVALAQQQEQQQRQEREMSQSQGRTV